MLIRRCVVIFGDAKWRLQGMLFSRKKMRLLRAPFGNGPDGTAVSALGTIAEAKQHWSIIGYPSDDRPMLPYDQKFMMSNSSMLRKAR
jgi:hypothetical protein